jgi:thioredoxin 1
VVLSEAGWKQRQQYYEEGPSPEWLALYRDANALLTVDPASGEAQVVADRWLDLSVRASRGDPQVQIDSPTAWADRDNWPEVMKQRVADFHLEEVTDFIRRVALHTRRKYFNESSWTRFLDLRKRAVAADPDVISRVWQAYVDLFREAAIARSEDPSGQNGRNLAQRWGAILDAESGGDAEILSSLMTAWSDWRHWPATLRWQMEAGSMLSGESFDLTTDFIVRAMEEHNRENTLVFSEASFEQDVLRATMPVLVSVWTKGCTGCARLAPLVDLIACEFKGRVKVGKLNAISNMDLAMRLEVRALPTVLLFVGGQAVEKRMGLITLADLQQLLMVDQIPKPTEPRASVLANGVVFTNRQVIKARFTTGGDA